MPLSEEGVFLCPYCGSQNSVEVDVTAGRNQKLITDCETCCAPIVVRLSLQGGQILSCDAQRENNP